MFRPLLLIRATIGLAATAVEQTVALPARAVETISAIPGIPVKLAGGLVQSYLHAGQTLTDLAIKGDRVIESVFPARSDQPEWATFDEDETEDGEVLDVSYQVYGTAPGAVADDAASADVPSGRVTRRAR